MNRQEEQLLLLCGQLQEPGRRPLSYAAYTRLCSRAAAGGRSLPSGALPVECLPGLGCSREEAARIAELLSGEPLLRRYLAEAEHAGVTVLTRLSAGYPTRLWEKMGNHCPPVFCVAGNQSLLQTECVSVVGSRKLEPENEKAAKLLGYLAAAEGLTLVSGNAAGADRTAQAACLEAGGNVILVLADSLLRHLALAKNPHVLLCSLDGYALPFTAQRALGRNHIIHALGSKTFAVQCRCGIGGTWAGCRENLRHGYSPLFVYRDGTEAMAVLEELGATGFYPEELTSLGQLHNSQCSLFDSVEEGVADNGVSPGLAAAAD